MSWPVRRRGKPAAGDRPLIPGTVTALKQGIRNPERVNVEIDGEFTVIAGSTATTKNDFASNSYALVRSQLINEKILVATSNPELLEFKDDVTFASASAAAAVITNHNINGRTAWKLSNSGQTLKDWQDSQILAPPVA